jgi:hypothetical protein
VAPEPVWEGRSGEKCLPGIQSVTQSLHWLSYPTEPLRSNAGRPIRDPVTALTELPHWTLTIQRRSSNPWPSHCTDSGCSLSPILKMLNKNTTASSVYDCTVEDVEYIYNMWRHNVSIVTHIRHVVTARLRCDVIDFAWRPPIKQNHRCILHQKSCLSVFDLMSLPNRSTFLRIRYWRLSLELVGHFGYPVMLTV